MFNSINKIIPQPGQESVWDYPRPPKLEAIKAHIEIICNSVKIADTQNAYRILETSHPPVYYLPPQDIKTEYLTPASGQSFCEWKGLAQYYTITIGDMILPKVAWYYSDPTEAFKEITNYVAFYASPMDGCYIDGEKVTAQPGNFYGGWITTKIVGPFKGEPGSWGW